MGRCQCRGHRRCLCRRNRICCSLHRRPHLAAAFTAIVDAAVTAAADASPTQFPSMQSSQAIAIAATTACHIHCPISDHFNEKHKSASHLGHKMSEMCMTCMWIVFSKKQRKFTYPLARIPRAIWDSLMQLIPRRAGAEPSEQILPNIAYGSLLESPVPVHLERCAMVCPRCHTAMAAIDCISVAHFFVQFFCYYLWGCCTTHTY